LARGPLPGAHALGWLAVQLALMGAIVIAGFYPPHWPDAVARPLASAGAVVAFVGAVLVYLGARVLGRNQLVERGPYRYIRHPIYAGGVLFFLGYSLIAGAGALALTAALAVVWGVKAAGEERTLTERFPAYEEYRRRTPRRFVPGVY
jgi:protein-S-isoprenylcysteine O-methyltransferase Ste14